MVRTGRTRVTECSATSGAPVDEIERLLTKVRADGYEMFRSSTTSPGSLPDLKLQLHDVDITAYRIAQGSPLVGKSIAQIGFKSRLGTLWWRYDGTHRHGRTRVQIPFCTSTTCFLPSGLLMRCQTSPAYLHLHTQGARARERP